MSDRIAETAEKCAKQLLESSVAMVAIIDQVLQGLANPRAAYVQADRAAAIKHALSLAQPNDVVLLAGKGHENYQEIKGLKLDFSDRDHAQAMLTIRGKSELAA